MKKSLIALAVLGALSGAASAQSSVTLYGILDIGVQWVEQGNPPATTGGVYTQESGIQINGGYQSGSRFGLRGAEALGGNWAAVFAVEGGWDSSTGQLQQGGRVFGRQSWAGLRHNAAGTFALGRFATPSSGTGDFDLFGAVDPFGTGWGVNSLGNTFIAANALREDNAILWASPSWAGFKLAAMYSARIDGAEAVPNGANTTGMTLAANWTWGPLFLAATYDQLAPADSLSNPSWGNPDQKMTQLGATFDFKFLKLHGAYAIQDNIRLTAAASNPGVFNPTGGVPFDNKAWMLGVSVPLFGGSLLGSYQVADADNINTATYQFEPDYNVWGIGYSYPFSRRTNMYIGYGQREWDGTVRLTSGPVAASQQFDFKQFAIGIRHLF